jgi:hypothetical protein
VAILFKPHVRAFVVSTALSGVFNSLLADKIEAINHLLGRDLFEWNAMGDSYA